MGDQKVAGQRKSVLQSKRRGFLRARRRVLNQWFTKALREVPFYGSHYLYFFFLPRVWVIFLVSAPEFSTCIGLDLALKGFLGIDWGRV
jgi:hypothetical protein